MTSWLNDTAVMSAGQIVIAAAAEEAALLEEKAESERVKYEKALRESNLHITQTQEEAQAAVAKLKTLEVELAEARITQVREATRGAEEARQLRLELAQQEAELRTEVMRARVYRGNSTKTTDEFGRDVDDDDHVDEFETRINKGHDAVKQGSHKLGCVFRTAMTMWLLIPTDSHRETGGVLELCLDMPVSPSNSARAFCAVAVWTRRWRCLRTSYRITLHRILI